MDHTCENDWCEMDAVVLCSDCLQVFILEAVADAVADRAAELKLYYDRKRRAD